MSNHETKTTTDHKTIKEWAEEREGKPARVTGTEKTGKGDGILRIDFPGYAEANLEEISWDEFFKIFDENNLEFLYQEETKDSGTSRFFKFVAKD